MEMNNRHLKSLSSTITGILAQERLYAFYSALALVVIQVGIGVVLKAAQNGGQYSFSPSASVTISELLKMLLAGGMFYREWKIRDREAGSVEYHQVGSPAGTGVPLESDVDEDSLEGGTAVPSQTEEQDLDFDTKGHGAESFWYALRTEVSIDVIFGLCVLALFYVLINNLIFVSYRLADPATVQLTKSGVTCVTALFMIIVMRLKVSGVQWLAIIMQVCGLVVTQYDPEAGSAYPLGTYVLLLFQVFLSAVSGVMNQALLQAEDSSLHANNIFLYGAGAASNLICHILVSIMNADEPSFFEGYGSFGAIMVIVNNVFIGLAINAVYKYADAIVKCLATAFATAILIFLSPIFFGSAFNLLILPGATVVFGASWLYALNPKTKHSSTTETKRQPIWHSFSFKSLRKVYPVFYLVALAFTLAVVAVTSIPDLEWLADTQEAMFSADDVIERVISPFNSTLAFIRWNSAHIERIPYLMKYEPFFHTIHVSMPNQSMANAEDDWGTDRTSLTHDSATLIGTIYRQVAYTMKVILETQPEITGLLYYHFDAWIDPLAWSSSDLNKIHFPLIIDETRGPLSICMTDVSQHGWWGWGTNVQNWTMKAEAAAKSNTTKYKINDQEWCLGWSDIYYIPRRYFEDYIYFFELFADPQFEIFHEVAIPTITHIIDQSLRENPYIPIVEGISDCWGDCCSSEPTAKDVLQYRCGHRLDYRNESVVEAFFAKLEGQTALLKKKPSLFSET